MHINILWIQAPHFWGSWFNEGPCSKSLNFTALMSFTNIASFFSQSPLHCSHLLNLAIRNFDDAELARIMADPALLHSFIGFHAAFGTVMSKDVTNDKELTTLAGYRIRMNVYTVNKITVSLDTFQLST